MTETADRKTMSITDRRSGQDRRAVSRREVTLDVEWEDLNERRPGTLSDLSPAGCFVLSSGDVSEGDIIKLFLPLGDGMKVQLTGVVRNHVLEIGFALNFIEPTEAQISVITGLMEQHGTNP